MKYRQPVLLGILLLSVLSLFVSRAGLSISMIAFVALTSLHRNIGAQLRHLLRQPVLLGMSGLFLVPLVSGLWSGNTDEWAGALQIKLPLIFFPLAFAGNWWLTPRQWRILAWFFLGCVALGAAWSLSGYLLHFEQHNEGFLRAQTFATPLGDDHVRFSWLVSIAALTVILMWPQSERRLRPLLAVLFLFYALYLHILAARTGLGSFYIILAASGGYLLWRRRSWLLGGIAVLLLVAGPLLAWRFLPSFHNRVQYIRYDFTFVKGGIYTPGANDGNRFISIRAGLDLLRQYPGGVGFGDIFPVANEWYDAHYPGMLVNDRFYPSSEWLVYGVGAGWAGVLLFSLCMLLPLLQRRVRYRFWWLVLNVSAAFSFLFDIGLEVQYGVYLYAFLLLWWWKWLTPDPGPADYASKPIDRHHL
ncbi:O-antigen ligase domain-containing protein [Flaviaesturariibacter flavus]|uniref:O-antigen ligase domain-containing protein n=1 Tax=Flaviaesturariibacter flavus TaxID=2502780 RepID=A0A4R1B8A3_9BACT|nr:O-antigen ligase family protein [Flaviaesturariibacter flavus]TCJ13108.1 O-antigen ligase domain-containing protein [Flaviaesturariibacter flavus]